MTPQTCTSYLLTPDDPSAVTTGTAPEDSLAVDVTQRAVNREGWDTVINDYLIEWGRTPQQLADDDLIPPSGLALAGAYDIVQKFRDANYSPPLRVVPDGDGGIVLERWSGDVTVAIEIINDGSAEYVLCRNQRVVCRHAL